MNTTKEYSQKLYNANDDLQALRELLHEVNARAESDAEFRPRQIRMAILRALRDATADDVATAQQIIVEDLWPLCVKGIEQNNEPSYTAEPQDDGTKVWTPSRKEEARRETHDARELLKTWIAAWVGNGETGLRVEIVQKTCAEALKKDKSKSAIQAACWTLVYIGWRSEETETTLWKIMERNDVAGDVASSALASLGIHHSDRKKYIEQLRSRAKGRPIAYNSQPMIKLRASELVEDAITLFKATPKLTWQEGQPLTADENVSIEMDMKLSFLGHFADAVWDDSKAQQKIWQEVFKACRDTKVGQQQLMFTGNLAPWCNVSQMIPDFLSMFPKVLEDYDQERDNNKKTQENIDPTHYPVYIATERLKAAIRPNQLEGWKALNINQLEPFKRIAFGNTHQTGYISTSPMRAKESAWEFLALAGKKWNTEDVQQALSEETSGFVQGEIAEIIACFGCSPLPTIVKETLTADGQEGVAPRDLDNGRDSSLFAACRGAEDIARCTTTNEAFQILLSFSYVYGDQVLRSTTDSIDEVAVYLVKQKKDETIIPALWNVVAERKPSHKYIGAVSALHALSAAEELPSTNWERLLSIAHDTDLDEFFRALAVQAIGFMSDKKVASNARVGLEKLWLEHRNNKRIELAGRAREALARHGTWDGENSRLFLDDIGLEERENQWRMKEPSVVESNDMAALFFLYRNDKKRFQAAVCDIIRSPREQATYELTFWLTHRDENGIIALDDEVALAMIDVIKETSTNGVHRYLFEALSMGAPKLLLQEQWGDVVSKWFTGARVALADAIGRVGEPPDNLETMFQTLELLIYDDSFVVRRAALRAMNVLAPTELRGLCLVWGDSESSDFERQIAAQGVFWLNDVPFQGKELLSEVLLNDREAMVREAAKDSLVANRDRQWGDFYLRQVDQASLQEQISAEAFAYGCALEQIGDDSHLHYLAQADVENMSPSVRYWRRHIIENLEKNWRDKTRKWDDLGEGAISEIIDGRVIQKEKEIEVTVWLRQRPAAGIRGVSGWGGRFRPKSVTSITQGAGKLILDDGRSGDILIGNLNFTFSAGNAADNEHWASFSGQDRLTHPQDVAK